MTEITSPFLSNFFSRFYKNETKKKEKKEKTTIPLSSCIINVIDFFKDFNFSQDQVRFSKLTSNFVNKEVDEDEEEVTFNIRTQKISLMSIYRNTNKHIIYVLQIEEKQRDPYFAYIEENAFLEMMRIKKFVPAINPYDEKLSIYFSIIANRTFMSWAKRELIHIDNLLSSALLLMLDDDQTNDILYELQSSMKVLKEILSHVITVTFFDEDTLDIPKNLLQNLDEEKVKTKLTTFVEKMNFHNNVSSQRAFSSIISQYMNNKQNNNRDKSLHFFCNLCVCLCSKMAELNLI